MRHGARAFALGLGVLAAVAALRASFADDSADGAFDSPAVKELAPRVDELNVDDQIALMKHVQRSLTAKLLAPSDESWKGFESLKDKGDAGLARILERGLFEGMVTPRGGGCYWSFSKQSNDYGKWPQLELQQWTFGTGFYGSNGGSVVKLDGASLLTMDESAVPEDLRAAPEDVLGKGRKSRADRPKAEAGAVYAVRAVMWDECDVLAAFQVVSVDAYGATIAWRVLKTYDVPKRKR